MSIKKYLLTFLAALMLLSLSACKPATPKETEAKHYSVIAPSGAPSLALLDLADDENTTIEIVDGADALTAEFSNAEKDFIIAPINLGVKLSQKTENYQLMAVLTWGNLFLVTKDENTSARLAGAKVAAFGEAAVPGKVIGYLAEELQGVEFEWFTSVQEASAAFLSGEYDAAVLAEPVLTMAHAKWKENNEEDFVVAYDLQELYKEKSGFQSYPQAALFVRKATLQEDSGSVVEFTNIIKQSISKYNGNADVLSKRIDEIDLTAFGFQNPDLIKKAYSKMALNYRLASECLEDIRNFLSIFEIELEEKVYVK
ncbi:MAG: hypothetical protein Q4F09_06280 [Erysipelotrichaceae bacterium]|nr:hypothetical protein [Erysipelotrichaceae bacterium]